MRIMITVILLFNTNYLLFTQTESIRYWIRSFQKSGLIEMNTLAHAYYLYDDYGAPSKKISINLKANKYLFNAQEFDFDIRLLFFSSRAYTPFVKRFHCPDPKSQYFSPYNFVGADPINVIDYDGNEGKLLVLYGQHGDDPFFKGAEEVLGDAYHYPIADFVENKIPKLKDWDGSIYVNTHMRAGTEHSIMVDAIDKKSVALQSEAAAAPKKTLF